VINFIDDQMQKVFEVLDFPIPPSANLDDFADSDVYQMIISFTEEENSKILPIFPQCYAPRWSPLFSDIIPNGVNKMVGIEKMIERLGITKDEVAAFGDGGNDIEMIESVGWGIAMGNACDELKRVAKFTTDDIDNDGLAKAVGILVEKGLLK
jgi:hydroxymethylpyrimidine pyrophosphatase-like HAD family hydrolase